MLMGNIDNQLQMVKKYERSSADKVLNNPSDIRRPFVLKETVKYLLEVVSSNHQVDAFNTYQYISNRLRCVRQDFSIVFSQNKLFRILKETVESFELMLEYLIKIMNKLRENSKELDEKVEFQQITECLSNLILIYKEGESF